MTENHLRNHQKSIPKRVDTIHSYQKKIIQ